MGLNHICIIALEKGKCCLSV
uniref:Uncharacterized protein n=1 Tax=Rhizophora mucronata TaxID=61149 RepID=A0A2P2M5Q3_RHIMU